MIVIEKNEIRRVLPFIDMVSRHALKVASDGDSVVLIPAGNLLQVKRAEAVGVVCWAKIENLGSTGIITLPAKHFASAVADADRVEIDANADGRAIIRTDGTVLTLSQLNTPHIDLDTQEAKRLCAVKASALAQAIRSTAYAAATRRVQRAAFDCVVIDVAARAAVATDAVQMAVRFFNDGDFTPFRIGDDGNQKVFLERTMALDIAGICEQMGNEAEAVFGEAGHQIVLQVCEADITHQVYLPAPGHRGFPNWQQPLLQPDNADAAASVDRKVLLRALEKVGRQQASGGHANKGKTVQFVLGSGLLAIKANIGVGEIEVTVPAETSGNLPGPQFLYSTAQVTSMVRQFPAAKLRFLWRRDYLAAVDAENPGAGQAITVRMSQTG